MVVEEILSSVAYDTVFVKPYANAVGTIKKPKNPAMIVMATAASVCGKFRNNK
jgi:hypothetical protein